MRKLIISMFTVAVLAFMSAANAAGKPDTLRLGPLHFTDQPVADCGDFDVLVDYTLDALLTFYYDRDGNDWRFTRKLFLENGNSIFYNSNDPSYWLPGAPGQREIDTFKLDRTMTMTANIFRVMLPGHGAIFLTAGRIIINEYREVIFQAGRSDYWNEDYDALCAALRP